MIPAILFYIGLGFLFGAWYVWRLWDEEDKKYVDILNLVTTIPLWPLAIIWFWGGLLYFKINPFKR